jgi:hypothetical protein
MIVKFTPARQTFDKIERLNSSRILAALLGGFALRLAIASGLPNVILLEVKA